MPEHYQYYQYLHSVKLHKGWRLKLNTSFNSDPIVIHIGEGTNRSSFKEINNLVKWNLAGKKIVGIHGISMTEKQSKQFLGLVWCPVSNYSLYNKSADIRLLKTHTDILFGTDSTLTGDWNLWNHLRFARKLGDLSDVELYNGITTTAARLWKTNSPYAIAPDGSADIVIAKRKFEDEWESFYSLNPEDLLLVLKKGEIILLDRELGDSVKILQTDKYDLISINAVQKYVTRGIKELAGLINGYLPAYRFPFSII
jgi:cytosine/adenosine deaminase-related metal-dependent hydrolase